MNDDLTLTVGGRMLAGWKSIRVTRGIERIPSDFAVSMTELYPGIADAFVVTPGEPCEVRLGSDLVITGYVDRLSMSIAPGQHMVSVTGRGKCADLVDCAAEWPHGQISSNTALGIAQKLCEPYGITAKALDDVGAIIPQFNLMLGETAFEVIERVCRYSALLAYDDVEGNLVLSRVGSVEASGSLREGVNIQDASVTYGVDQRYSSYVAFLQAVDVFSDIGDTGNLLATVSDPAIRHREKVIIAEAGGGGLEVAKQRAAWEMARRFGRSWAIRVTTDGWRDSAGVLYTPNTLLKFSIPSLKVSELQFVISEVAYRRDEQGTVCELVLMPVQAFLPQPILLQPVAPDVAAAAAQAGLGAQ